MEEQKRVLAESNGVINWDSLGKMAYMEICIKEALRLNPPIIFLMRKAVVDYSYKDFAIPAGDTLFVPIFLNHRLPSIYAEPNKFDPERWLPPREEQKKADYAYQGFGAGRHECMGQRFAIAQIKSIWTILFRDFGAPHHCSRS